jgi:hypothetical protein
MDVEQARRHLIGLVNADLEHRRQLQEETDQTRVRIGANAELLRREYGVSRTQLSRLVGVPAATLEDLMTHAAKQSYTVPDPSSLLPVLQGDALQEYVRAHGPMDRIVGGAGDGDVVYLSGIHLDRFAQDSVRGEDPVPHLVLHLAGLDGWVGVGNVNIGYDGTAPRNAQHELLACGVDSDMVEEVVSCSAVDVTISRDGPQYRVAAGRSLFGLGVPRPLGPRYVADIAVDFDRVDPHADDVPAPPVPQALRTSRLSARVSPGTLFGRWIELLDSSEPPEWASGERHATVYTTYEAAESDGFTVVGRPESGLYRIAHPRIIIEQGRIQLWVSAPGDHDPTHWLPGEFYDVLSVAGLFPTDIAERDAHNALRKLITRHSSHRPEVIPINGGVTWTPSSR